MTPPAPRPDYDLCGQCGHMRWKHIGEMKGKVACYEKRPSGRDHGCTCSGWVEPVPPSPPPASADLKALVRQVVDAAYEVGGATLHANSALSDQQQRYWTDRRAELLDYEKRIEKELLAHVASLTARLAAAEAETERFQQAALRGIDLAEAYGADRQKAYDKIFQPQRGAP